MKYLVVLCDGMADRPCPELSGKTPMEAANKPNMDFLAKSSEVGMCKTVAEGLKPGSDVANLSVLGYDPMTCYTGRSPLEAASIGVPLTDTDVALRCNLVTLSDEENYEEKTMVDYCADDISTAEAEEIIKTVKEHFDNEIYKFYSGVSYRHCLTVKDGTTELGTMTPPHDISGRVIGEYLSNNENAKPLIDLMKKSFAVLKDHPVNKKRIENGRRPANSIWLWGEGRKPALQNFFEKNGVKGGIVSAVDLLKGIGICAGMETPFVEDATAYIDTNYEGKVAAAKTLFENGCDFAYIHVEAPDECGHRGEVQEKAHAIELIDEKVLSPMLDYLKNSGEHYRILIMPDHPTPLETRTHCADPVPYLIYDSEKEIAGTERFTEALAEKMGNYISHGPSVMDKLLQK